MFCAPKDAVHSFWMPFGGLHVAMGQGEVFTSRALTVPASLKQRYNASKIPLSSPGLPGEGQRPLRPGQGSDMGIGMEAMQGVHHPFSLGLYPLLLCSSPKAVQLQAKLFTVQSRMGTRISLPRVTNEASSLLTLPHQKALLAPGLVHQVTVRGRLGVKGRSLTANGFQEERKEKGEPKANSFKE